MPRKAARMRIPRGFGFVVPQFRRATKAGRASAPGVHLRASEISRSCPGRTALLRAFFGGSSAAALLGETDDRLAERACLQLGRILGPLPEAAETLVRRWPLSMPQYAVGHLERMAELESLLSVMPGLHLVGSAYHGVGLPDLNPSGTGHCPIARGQPYPSPVLNTVNVSNITKDQTLLLTTKIAVARSECALTSSFSC